ncbi:MAG: glutamine--tRNA ligase/YqeY domain fusion protein, partial [Planctomycetota bacterium]
MPTAAEATDPKKGADFIRAIVKNDLRSGKHSQVVTRFPPEPNGYLHIGHAKSICLNFGLALENGGRCHLRMDDTNPEAEDQEYVDAIIRDVRWLGFDWGEHMYFASDYYERLYEFAEFMVKAGRAYVCSLNEEEIREYRGTVKTPGRESPYRSRSVEENLDLLRRMKAGEFDEGAHVLRAKIDMAANNMKMRDPLLVRIRKTPHYRRGDAWCIYPMYDFAHGLSDSIEGITHSICTLEFENNRELYDWLLVAAEAECRPQQIEFARLNLTYTVMSKRKLKLLVEEGRVSGWDDPRMPTIAGLRRRGITKEALRAFCEAIGVAKTNSMVDLKLFEHTIRDDLNSRAPRVMGVLDPIEVVIDNYPEGKSEELEASYWPHDVPKEGTRMVPFGKRLFIERDDFREDPPKKFFRLAPGREVRLRYAYLVTCTKVVKDEQGAVTRLHCTHDPATRGGNAPDGRKVKGTIHWVSAEHAIDAEVRVYDRLFSAERPEEEAAEKEVSFTTLINEASLKVRAAKLEPSLASAEGGSHFQFERQGYFFVDPLEAEAGRLVFNRTVALRDSWAKVVKGPAKAVTSSVKASAKPAPTPQPAVARAAFEPRDAAEAARYARYTGEHGLAASDAELILTGEGLSGFYEGALGAGA